MVAILLTNPAYRMFIKMRILQGNKIISVIFLSVKYQQIFTSGNKTCCEVPYSPSKWQTGLQRTH